jgi:hypothetical protein
LDVDLGDRFDAGVDALCRVVVFWLFWVVFPCFYGFEKVWREVRFLFGGVGASVELRQIFDVLDFTYVGLHTSTYVKYFFFELHLHT